MPQKIGIAIVGCGLVADFHLAAISQLDNCQLVGVYDRSGPAADKRAKAHSCKAYASYEDLLSDSAVDAVAICTPSGLHAEQTLAALAAKKHVLTEKPLALNLADSGQIVKKAREAGLQVSVVSQLRFSPAIQEAKRIIESGRLGRLVSGDIYMKYHRSKQYYAENDWRGTIAMDGGGALMNQGIHGVDLARYLLGPVESIFAQARTLSHAIETEDTLSAVLTYQNGSLGVIQATTSVYPGFSRRLEISGDKGSLVIEEDKIIQQDILGEPPFQPESRPEFSSWHDPAKINPAGHLAQYKNFLGAIAGTEELLTSAQAGHEALEIILSAYLSSQKQQVIYLDQKKE